MLNRLRYVIQKSGLSQNKFAEKIGADGPVLSKILNGKRRLGDGMIARVVARVGVNEHWLRTGEGEPFATPEPPVAALSERDALERYILGVVAEMSPEHREIFLALARKVAEQYPREAADAA